MSYGLGIDLGTTSTAAAVVRGRRAGIVRLTPRSTAVATVVRRETDGRLVVGEPPGTGDLTPGRAARDVKRRVGDPTPLLLGAQPVEVERLLAEVLAFVAAAVEAVEGGPPASTVVAHPGHWGPFKREVLVSACRLAGLDRVELMTEPAAVATWCVRTARLRPGATVAVYDLGGGTFDAAVLEAGRGGTVQVRGQPEGIERLGGIDIDAAVVDHVLGRMEAGIEDLDCDDPAMVAALARLRRLCAGAKEALASERAVVIPVVLPG
ncbi:MAG TPA: Hsp70 family protein, partial [Acidimicrobiales bacterium]|nr:Hsp70 family protein [Acidimicrobiales bacterium]